MESVYPVDFNYFFGNVNKINKTKTNSLSEISKQNMKSLDRGLIEKPKSSLGIKYPTLRDNPLHTSHLWIKGKQADDGAEGLWRIHDSLYDLRDFIDQHPGGSDWLKLTKGTDITEAFESHHLQDYPSRLLKKFYVRTTITPRNYPFTFKDDGFYKTLRRRIREEMKTIPKNAAFRSKYLTDLLFTGYVTFAVLAAYFGSFILGGLSGIFLGLTAVAAHNFFHQRDNFRMYYFDFTLMDYRDWRISHALSHHLYTNTINDLEISAVEPWLQYLPIPKTLFFKYISWLYSPIVYSLMFIGHFIKSVVQAMTSEKSLELELLLPLVVPILMYSISGKSLVFCIIMYTMILIVGSLHFGFVGVNAGHHHPDNFHDGDTYRPKDEMDWGIFQLDAVMDRKDITGSHFLVLISFGDHALHHMFPTIDHGLLDYFYPVFLQTCKEFGVEWKLSSQLECIRGQYRQLSKTEPRKKAPKPTIK